MLTLLPTSDCKDSLNTRSLPLCAHFFIFSCIYIHANLCTHVTLGLSVCTCHSQSLWLCGAHAWEHHGSSSTCLCTLESSHSSVSFPAEGVKRPLWKAKRWIYLVKNTQTRSHIPSDGDYTAEDWGSKGGTRIEQNPKKNILGFYMTSTQLFSLCCSLLFFPVADLHLNSFMKHSAITLLIGAVY